MSGYVFDDQRKPSSVSCQQCYRLLKDYRYKCVTCEDYDQCTTCEKMHVHSEHFMIRIPVTVPVNPLGDRFSKMVGRMLLELMHGVGHIESIYVDKMVLICKKETLSGYRYKCVTCDDYDLCEACQGSSSHAEHLMIRIPRPYFFTLGESVQEFEQMLIKTLREAREFLINNEDGNALQWKATSVVSGSSNRDPECNPSVINYTDLPIPEDSRSQPYNITVPRTPRNPLTYPNINLERRLMREIAECMACGKLSKANHVLEPCGHRPACENCSEDMTRCLICNADIGQLVTCAQCMVCSKLSVANYVLRPCEHAPACERCSATMTHCLICEAEIEWPSAEGLVSLRVGGVGAERGHPSRQEVEEASSCLNCGRKNTTFFQCGHDACHDCAGRFICPICQLKDAKMKNYGGIFLEAPTPEECLVCSKVSEANTILHPCGHRPACEGCSAELTECLICNSTVGLPFGPELEECVVCSVVSEANSTLQPCGHRPACEGCSVELEECLICNNIIVSVMTVDPRRMGINNPTAETAENPTPKNVIEKAWICSACTLVNCLASTVCSACGRRRSLEKKINRTNESRDNFDHYVQLAHLDRADLTLNSDQFECPVCMTDCLPSAGVILRDCLHSFCKECLADHVKHSTEAEVKCPYGDDVYNCDSVIQEREIKSLVDEASYEKHLEKSVNIAENVITNTFHCKSADCIGWCEFDENVVSFHCPVCMKENCIKCQAIHEGKNCKDYQEHLKLTATNTADELLTRRRMEEMLTRGEAMHCPSCRMILAKIQGCDWLLCSVCKTEICWATKGPRWGPKGRGDTSGGCRCRSGPGRAPCHPQCGYCH